MSGSIPAGSWQRTGEYQTRGVPVLHGLRWQLPLCVADGIDPRNFYPRSVLQQDGILYVTYSARNGESACCAIEAQSGTLRWRFMVADRLEDLPDSLLELDEDQPEGRSPGSVSSIVLTATTAFVSTTYGVVYGLDLSSGQPTWKIDIDDLATQLGEEAFEGLAMDAIDGGTLDVLAVVGNLLFVSVESEAEGICGIDIAERTCRWHTFGLNNGPLTLWDNRLYGRDMFDQHPCYIYSAFDWHRQLTVWQSYCRDADAYRGPDEESYIKEEGIAPVEISMGGYLPLFNKTLYVVGLDESWRKRREEEEEDYGHYQLIALDAQTGEVRWTYSLAELGFGDHHYDVTVANGLVYLSQSENLCAVDLETHQLRWRHQPASPPSKLYHSSPVLADGLWYECRSDGVLLVLDALTGEERWRYSLDRTISQPCLVDDGSVYVIAGTTLYALY